jgi:hypothetical protein
MGLLTRRAIAIPGEHAVPSSLARRLRDVILLVCALVVQVDGQSNDVSLEYRVKAVYLFNFAKFIEWPSAAVSGPLTICVAGDNPFGDVLNETVRGELVNERPVITRPITTPDRGCHVLFLPHGTASLPFLRAVRGTPTLTVGEDPGFLREGGIVNFILEAGKVRFEIDQTAAESADLRISSHLLRLARPAGKGDR